MTIQIGPDLERVLSELAHRHGVAPEAVALNALRERFLAAAALQPRDEWERRLLGAATNCGASLSNEAVSSEGLND